MKYDIVVILNSKEEPKHAEDRVKTLLDKEGFQIAEFTAWGKKPLAYPIKKQTDGLYFAMVASSATAGPKQLLARIKLEEAILRALILKKKTSSKVTVKNKQLKEESSRLKTGTQTLKA